MEFGINLNMLEVGEKYSIDEWRDQTKSWDGYLLSMMNLVSVTPYEKRVDLTKMLSEISVEKYPGAENLIQLTIQMASLSKPAFKRLVTSVQLNVQDGVYKIASSG